MRTSVGVVLFVSGYLLARVVQPQAAERSTSKYIIFRKAALITAYFLCMHSCKAKWLRFCFVLAAAVTIWHAVFSFRKACCVLLGVVVIITGLLVGAPRACSELRRGFTVSKFASARFCICAAFNFSSKLQTVSVARVFTYLILLDRN